MKRYYLSEIIGDGTEENPYRPALSDSGVSHSAIIPSDANGVPINAVALCVVSAPNHGRLISDARNTALPDFVLDAKVSAMHSPTKAGMIAGLRKHGIATDFIGSADGYREVIRGIAHHLGEPTFDENSFDAND